MFERDLLVAVIAFGLGAILLVSALANHEAVFQSPKGEFLTRKLGRRHARLVVGAIGSFVLFLGYLLVAPYLFRNLIESPSADTSEKPANAALALPTAID